MQENVHPDLEKGGRLNLSVDLNAFQDVTDQLLAMPAKRQVIQPGWSTERSKRPQQKAKYPMAPRKLDLWVRISDLSITGLAWPSKRVGCERYPKLSRVVLIIL